MGGGCGAFLELCTDSEGHKSTGLPPFLGAGTPTPGPVRQCPVGWVWGDKGKSFESELCKKDHLLGKHSPSTGNYWKALG